MTDDKIGVLFICLGNICRSPSAQGIFERHVAERNMSDLFRIDSAGTAPFNVGKSPDPRAVQATEKYGYDIAGQIARQIQSHDFDMFDYILPMDRKNMMSITAWQPPAYAGEIKLFKEYHPNPLGNKQIPDPYHDGVEQFYPIIEIIEESSRGLLDYIIKKHNL